ncbi:hypothetical protein PDIG_90310 [Lichtheimia corymbifera JMRC:FSU:9682]|uniref:Uncharacterized protein n=1 Tax=Lichtheimia corymbifera JMRC:FSU:9682 TaxID=1263082 RepID=A0A068SH29_9FUNG|nr:hypothetical protein PDIG_90310 [Lichtheimia corymbifera JMRC:FSU:9682]
MPASVHGVSESTTYGSVKEKNAQARGIQVYFRAAGEPHFTKEEYRTAIIDFVISASLPFTIVENDSFQRLITLAQLAPSPASAKLPSPRTIRRDINAQHATLFEQISAMLSSQPFLAYTLDCWTSEWSDPFLAVTAHFINSDWVQQSVVIGMEPLTGTHSGQNLAFAFVSILRSMGLATKQFYITTDNASNMKKMAQFIEGMVTPQVFDSIENRIPCIAHVLNLAAQAIIKDGLQAGAQEPDEVHDLSIGQNDATNDHPGVILRRLRKGINAIYSSPQRIEHYRQCCEATERVSTGDDIQQESDLEDGPSTMEEEDDYHYPTIGGNPKRNVKELILDCPTRWSSTYNMVKRALEMKRPYNMACRSTPDLELFTLSDYDWDIIRELLQILRPFALFTKMLCADNYPTLSGTIVGYNRVIDCLERYRGE